MIKIEGNTIVLDKVPKKIKKITGTRLASILGLDPWKSPFKTWCDMTKVYVEPFEENEFTRAGKIIEPKVITYLDKRYHYGKGRLKDPFSWFGKTTEELRYDHFPEQEILGGMWDARTEKTVYELKTSKRVEDWYQNGEFDAPMNYKIQGALYAYLLGLDEFVMVLSITDDAILANPNSFEPTPENTMFRKYSLAKDMPYFSELVEDALVWYEKHIGQGISPEWSDKDSRDKEVLAAITTQALPTGDPGTDPITAIIAEIEPLQDEIDAVEESIGEKKKRLSGLKDALKSELQPKMKDTDKKINATGQEFKFELARGQKKGYDEAAMKADGVLGKYQTMSETLTLRMSKI